jgi:polar amino acid transport system substrate-binding protein
MAFPLRSRFAKSFERLVISRIWTVAQSWLVSPLYRRLLYWSQRHILIASYARLPQATTGERHRCEKEQAAMKRVGYLSSLAMVLVLGFTAYAGGTSASFAPRALAAAGVQSRPADNFLATLRKKGALTIGTSNDAPLSYVGNKTGQPLGVLPDMIRYMLRREHIMRLKVVTMPFQDLIPSITSGRIDMIGDGMYDTAAREKVISFTVHTMFNPEGLVVRKGNPAHLHSIAAGALHGHSVGTYEGTVWVGWLQALHKTDSSIQVKLYPTIQDVMADIAAGRLDAGVIDASISAYAIKQNPNMGIELVKDYKPADKAATAIAFGVAKNHNSLRLAFNRAYRAMTKDGTLKRILRKWGLPPSLFLP